MTIPNAIGPTELQGHVDRVRERHALGILAADDATAALGRIHLVDADGSAWTIGVRSRSWYRFRDGRWVAAGRAPDPARLLTARELLGTCASCGAPSGGGSLCAACGVEQAPSRLRPEAGDRLARFLETGYDTLPEPLPERPTVADAARPVVSRSAAVPATSERAVPAPVVPARQARRGWLPAVMSTVIGAGLLVVSGSRLALDVIGDVFEPPIGSAMPTLVADDGRSGASAAPSETPDASAAPASTPPSTEPPSGAVAWFSDDFDAASGWPSGDDGLLAAAYEDGRYVVTAHATDLPVYRWADNEAAVGSALAIEASIVFETGGPIGGGLAVADAGGMSRLLVLLEPGGEWAISRDDLEAFETLAAGRAAPIEPGTVHRLRLELDAEGRISAWLDGVELGAATASLDVAAFGVAAWSVEDGFRVAIDDYRVTVP